MPKRKLRFNNFRKDLDEQLKKSDRFKKLFRIERAKLRIAHKLADLREKMGFTQSQLARKMRVSQQLISRIESGSDNLTLETLITFLDVFNVAWKIKEAHQTKKKEILEFA